MSKGIVGLIAVLTLILSSPQVNARESKGEKRQHAKNLQALFFQIDSNLLADGPTVSKSDNISIDSAFEKVAVKLINKREVKKIRTEILEFETKTDLRKFRQYIEKMFVVRLAPSMTPSKSKGRELYVKHCADCHGASGSGDGIFAARLNPKPKSLLTRNFAKNVTPHMIFNYTVYGLPTGVMKSLSEILDYYDIWCLSYYVSGLPFDQSNRSNLSKLNSSKSSKDLTLKDLASLDLHQLKEAGACSTESEERYIRTVLPYLESKSRR